MVGHQPELPGQQPEATTAGMAADTHRQAGAAGDGDTPALVQRLVDPAQLGAGLHLEGPAQRIVRDPVHAGDVEDEVGVRMADEVRVAVPATAHREPFARAHRLLDDLQHLLGAADQPDGLRARDPALVHADHQLFVPGVLGVHGHRSEEPVDARTGHRLGPGRRGAGRHRGRHRPGQHRASVDLGHAEHLTAAGPPQPGRRLTPTARPRFSARWWGVRPGRPRPAPGR